MGKSSSSCLKIIACGKDSAVEDDVEAPEGKGSSEKCGWSFRKRSARHRVLSNSVTSENVALGNKETSQSSTVEIKTPPGPTISEKVLALEQLDEKFQPPATLKLEPPKSVEPELSEAPDALKSFEPEVSETLHAPEQQESFETEVSETLFASKQAESFELEVPERVDASESPELVEPETYVLGGESKSLNLAEQEVSETLADSDLEPSEPVESDTHVSVGESEPLDLEPTVPEKVVSSTLEPPQPAESKIFEGDVPGLPVTTEAKQSEAMISSEDDILEEPIVITIQTGVRRILAQRELVKLRSIVKLQAALRGHLVRRQAVDTLYCMQGIVKEQSLVRTRQSMLLGDGVSVNETITAKSTENLFGNAFARQLLESTPNAVADSEAREFVAEDVQFQAEKISSITECENLSKVVSESTDPEFAVQETPRTLENEQIFTSSVPAEEYQPPNLISIEEKTDKPYFDSTDAVLEPLGVAAQNDQIIQSFNPSEEYQPSNLLSSEGKSEQPFNDPTDVVLEPLGVAAQNDQIIQSDSCSETQSVSLSPSLAVEIEEPRLSTKRMASEEVDVENTKFAYGSRKASSPAFIAAHSKFEELSSSAASSVSLKSPHHGAGVEFHPNTVSSLEESVLKEKESSSSKAFIPDEFHPNMGGSECGTELSVTSALDSPDRFEAEVAEMDLEAKYVKEEEAIYPIIDDLGVKANGHSSVHDSNLFASTVDETEFQESDGIPKPVVAADFNLPEQKPEAIASDEHDNGEYVVLNMGAGSPQVAQTPEMSASDLQVELGSQAEQPEYKSSPEATPNHNHVTVAESQGTPSSQVSVKTKKSKVDKSRSNAKHSSHSGGKRAVAKPLLDSGVRSSVEHLSKDQKSGKRRNSFGAAKSDNIDQEPRDSTSSNKALPSYMQATQSAKAKSNSPRSSSDVQDKEAHIIKKRHSLPVAGGKQGSPRVERPISQSPKPQAVKGNVSTPPQERKWLR